MSDKLKTAGNSVPPASPQKCTVLYHFIIFKLIKIYLIYCSL